MENTNEKKSMLKTISNLFKGTMIFLFPSFKLLNTVPFLIKCQEVFKPHKEDKEMRDWFKKQIMLTIILSLVLFVPLISSFNVAKNIIAADFKMYERMEQVSKMSLFEKFSGYHSVFYPTEKDSKEERRAKMHTQARILASFIWLGGGLGLQFFLSMLVLFQHRIITDSARLKKELISGGLLRREDEKKAIVFATPLGFLLSVPGQGSRDFQAADRIWQNLNIRIKDVMEHPEQRSLVFVRKAFELKSGYLYKADEIKL